MTDARTREIKDRLDGWLGRYTPPKAIRSNPEAVKQELMSLLRIMLKYAPTEGYERWCQQAFDACSEIMKTRAWPTANELGSACIGLRKEAQGSAHYGYSRPEARTAAEITAGKIAQGEAVGEGWLYGILACELIANKLVSQSDMTRYRSAAYHNRCQMYGEDAALNWERDAKERHEAAKGMWRDRRNRRSYDAGNLKRLVNDGALDHVAY